AAPHTPGLRDALPIWIIAPIAVRLPLSVLYPTGERQEQIVPKHGRFFAWADVIAGDWHYIRRHMPPSLGGKVILTNTVTAEDVRSEEHTSELQSRENL